MSEKMKSLAILLNLRNKFTKITYKNMERTNSEINSIEHVDAKELLTFAKENSNLKVIIKNL